MLSYEEKTCGIISLFIGLMIGTILGGYIQYNSKKDIISFHNQIQKEIEQCQEELPRNQFCTYQIIKQEE